MSDPLPEPPRRQYTIEVIEAGRQPLLPALLVEAGFAPEDVPRRVREHPVTLRVRARTPDGQVAVDRLWEDLGPGERAQEAAPADPRALYAPRETLEAAAQARLASDGAAAALGREVLGALANAAEPLPYSTRIGGRTFHWGQRTHVMGIVNVTPDSFSGDGLLAPTAGARGVAAAVARAVLLQEQGADLLDLGAESTRPGSQPVPEDLELERLLPALRAIRREVTIPISVDTYKTAVARAALADGADLINDVSGLQGGNGMAAAVAEHQAAVVLMHNRLRQPPTVGTAMGGRYVGVRYADLVLDVLEALGDMLDAATGAGVARRGILLDPGLGFGKTVNQSLRLVRHAGALRSLGQPVLVGPSRKSFVGYAAGAPVGRRLHGTMAAVAMTIAAGGADVVRVHDVEAAVQTVALADAIRGCAAPSLGATGP